MSKKPKNSIEGNILMAYFIGLSRGATNKEATEFKWIIPYNQFYDYIDDDTWQNCSDEELRFHADWQWLMFVYNKVREHFKNLRNFNPDSFEQPIKLLDNVMACLLDGNMDSTYEALLDYIVWSNDKTEKKS